MPQHNDQGNMQITHGIALYDSLNEEFDNHFCSVYTRSFEFISSIRCLISRFLQYRCANHKMPSVIFLMEWSKINILIRRSMHLVCGHMPLFAQLLMWRKCLRFGQYWPKLLSNRLILDQIGSYSIFFKTELKEPQKALIFVLSTKRIY